MHSCRSPSDFITTLPFLSYLPHYASFPSSVPIFFLFNALLHSYSIEEECWNMTITSQSRYLYSCSRDLRSYRVAHTRSLSPLVHTSYSD